MAVANIRKTWKELSCRAPGDIPYSSDIEQACLAARRAHEVLREWHNQYHALLTKYTRLLAEKEYLERGVAQLRSQLMEVENE